MNISEAMRLGAMSKPQAEKALRRAEASYDVRSGQVVKWEGTCAMGAAFDAVGILEQVCNLLPYQLYHRTMPTNFSLMPEGWGKFLMARPFYMPSQLDGSGLNVIQLDGSAAPRLNVILHLNDLYGWTREQIADWVESEEIKAAAAEAEAGEAQHEAPEPVTVGS